jgi:hypothetical protein
MCPKLGPKFKIHVYPHILITYLKYVSRDGKSVLLCACVFQLANGVHNIALQEEKQLGLKLCLRLIQTLSTHVVCKHMIGLGMAWHAVICNKSLNSLTYSYLAGYLSEYSYHSVILQTRKLG